MSMFIKVGRNTAGHRASLESLGYTVTEGKRIYREKKKGKAATYPEVDTFEIDAVPFEGDIDLSNGAKWVIEQLDGKLATYATNFVAGNITVKGLQACFALEALHPGLSCIVAKDGEAHDAKVAKQRANVAKSGSGADLSGLLG